MWIPIVVGHLIAVSSGVNPSAKLPLRQPRQTQVAAKREMSIGR